MGTENTATPASPAPLEPALDEGLEGQGVLVDEVHPMHLAAGVTRHRVVHVRYSAKTHREAPALHSVSVLDAQTSVPSGVR